MIKSLGVTDAMGRTVKERLEMRGFEIAESRDAEGYVKLSSAKFSVAFKQIEQPSKDVLGLDHMAFTPHILRLSVVDGNDTSADITVVESAKLYMELIKLGMKVSVSEGISISAAETATPVDLEFDVLWPGKGI